MRLDQGLLHRWISERGPLLKQLNPEHGGQWIGRPTTLLARFGGKGFDQCDQRLPGHQRLHLREKLLTFGLLFSGSELVIRETELLAYPSTQS